MLIPRLREADYFDDETEMHYALLQSAEKIGPTLHTHDFFEIFLLIEGQIKHIVNGRQFVLREGVLTFIRPDDAHYFRPVPGQPCQIINLAVARQPIEDLFAYLGAGFRAERILQPLIPLKTSLPTAVKRQVQSKLDQLNRIPLTHTPEKRTALRMLLFELVTQYFSLTLDDAPNDWPRWFQHACAEMQKPENMLEGVARMREISAVSAEHLSRTVRKYLQQTPTDYVNQLRLNAAANLLTHADRSIIDIATAVGFKSLSYFYVLFKVEYGQTPRQFRHTHQPQLTHDG